MHCATVNTIPLKNDSLVLASKLRSNKQDTSASAPAHLDGSGHLRVQQFSIVLLKGQCHDTGGKWKTSSIRKILIILFGHLWVVEETYIYIFAFKFTFTCLQPDIVPISCHRCQWHRWQICRRCHWYRWQFAAGIVDTGGKLATGVNNTRGTGGKICHRCRWYRCHWHRWQICHRCRWHRWCTLTCKYLREFSKKFEMILMLLSGAWGKVIHEKNLKQKISWHCPFKLKSKHSFRYLF